MSLKIEAIYKFRAFYSFRKLKNSLIKHASRLIKDDIFSVHPGLWIGDGSAWYICYNCFVKSPWENIESI